MLLVDPENILEIIRQACENIGRPPKPLISRDLINRNLFEKKAEQPTPATIELIKDALWQIIEFYLLSDVKEFFRKRPRSQINIPTGEHYFIDDSGTPYCSHHYLSLRRREIIWVREWGFQELLLPRNKGDLARLMLKNKPLIKAMVVDLLVLLSWDDGYLKAIIERQINRPPKLLKKERVKQ